MENAKQTKRPLVVDTSPWEAEDVTITPADDPAVVALAKVLPRVAALASRVNSADCTDRDRERLRELVPAGTYFLLLLNLVALRSTYARQQQAVVMRRGRVSIDLLTFFEDYRAKEV